MFVLSRRELLRDEHVTAAKETINNLFWHQRIIWIQTVSMSFRLYVKQRASHSVSIPWSQKGILCRFCVPQTTVKLVLSFRAFKEIKLNFYDMFLCFWQFFFTCLNTLLQMQVPSTPPTQSIKPRCSEDHIKTQFRPYFHTGFYLDFRSQKSNYYDHKSPNIYPCSSAKIVSFFSKHFQFFKFLIVS